MSRKRLSFRKVVRWHGGASIAFLLTQVAAAANNVTFSTIALNAYATGDINSCAVGVNSLTTAGGFEFAAFYDLNRNVIIGRRATGGTTWSTFGTGLTITASEITDDHNIIAIGVDSIGTMHLSYNMHNTPLRYATSNSSVLGALGGTSIGFTTLSSLNAPTLFPDGGTSTNEVTYPQFYNIPGSNNLLFTFRNGGTGGGSGNGNNYVDIYNPSTQTWSQTFVLNGMQTSVNGYTNSFAYDSTGKLAITWTWRTSPDWRTNSNIMYTQSPDNGLTWQQQDGTPYGLPIVQSISGPNPLPAANQVGQVILNIPQGSGLINQTSMTIDKNNHPIVATWWAPDWIPTAFNAGSGNPNRQYMLEYYNGTQWLTSQITHRTTDTSFDTTAANVRDLGRPIVVVDNNNRVLVLMRFEDTGLHINNGVGYNPANPGNNLVVAYTNDLITGNTINNWNFVTLDNANMGSLEPTYDPQLWAAQNKLAIIYEPVGLSGINSTSIKVMEWDENAYFASLITVGQWTAAGVTGNWSNSTNWSNSPLVQKFPNNGSGFTFDATINTGNVTLDVNPTVHALTLSGGTLSGTGNFTLTDGTISGTYNITGTTTISGGTLNLTAGAHNAGAFTGTGTLAISAGVTLNVGAITVNTVTLAGALNIRAGAALSRIGNLTLSGTPGAWTAKLELAANSMIVANGSNIPSQLKQGAALGAWNSTAGITSTSAQTAAGSPTATALAYAAGSQFTANTGQTTFSGRPFLPSDTLILYTLAGDANMDQIVTFADFLQLQNHYNQPNTDWQGGDFNYDGSTTFADFLILQNNYNKTLQGSSLSTASPVPEPASILILLVPFALARRCRRAAARF